MPKQQMSTSLQKIAQVTQLDTLANKSLEVTMQQQAKLCLPQGYQSTSTKQAPKQTCFCNPNLRSHQVQLSYLTRMGQIAAGAGRAMLTSCCLNSRPCVAFCQKEILQACPVFSPSSEFPQQQVCPPPHRSHLSSLSTSASLHLCPQTVKMGLS